VSDFSAAKEIVRQIEGTFGGIDILVNNAGITRDKLVPQMKEEDFDRVLDVNLKGAFNMIRHTYMGFAKKRGGRIINISSVAGIMGNPGQANYAAAKAGMLGLTKTVARELAGRNVTCNAIAPGFIDTAMTEALPPETVRQALESVPMKRMGRPENIAHMAVFLASELAEYVTGQVSCVDGGMCM
jgi:3-oxoacyl-[acyl-carrier protein] reductase